MVSTMIFSNQFCENSILWNRPSDQGLGDYNNGKTWKLNQTTIGHMFPELPNLTSPWKFCI